MRTDLHLQPKFSLLVQDTDITYNVLSITVDQQEDLITAMDVELKHGLYYLDVIKIGNRFRLYAGTFDQSNYKLLFEGNVVYIRP